MFIFLLSAGFHIAVKLHNTVPEKPAFRQLVDRNALKTDNLHLPVADSLIKKQSLAVLNNQVYYQLLATGNRFSYVNAASGQPLNNGDFIFAESLAKYYSGKRVKPRLSLVTHYTEEYGFINKRLPVVLARYPGNDDWYIETSTGKLAAHIAGIDRVEGFSFIFLHKYFWLTWAGKDVRDIVSMLAALSVLAVALLGFTAFIKNK